MITDYLRLAGNLIFFVCTFLGYGYVTYAFYIHEDYKTSMGGTFAMGILLMLISSEAGYVFRRWNNDN